MPVTITSWDPSPSTGGPQEDTEDESGGGLRRFTPAEQRKKKKGTKRKLPKRNLLRFCLWPLENVSLPTAKDDALDCATDEWGSEIDVQIFPWLLWPSARIVPL